MWIIKIIKIKCFYPPQILDEHWCIYSCLQIPARESWFQYVQKVYATAINFPCIITLIGPIYLCSLQLELTISWASLTNLDYILELLYLQISCTLPSLSYKLAQSDAKLGIMSFTSSKLKQALCSIKILME